MKKGRTGARPSNELRSPSGAALPGLADPRLRGNRSFGPLLDREGVRQARVAMSGGAGITEIVGDQRRSDVGPAGEVGLRKTLVGKKGSEKRSTMLHARRLLASASVVKCEHQQLDGSPLQASQLATVSAVMAKEWSNEDEAWLRGVRDRVRGWLAATMEELGIHNAEVARRTGLSTSTVSTTLSGKGRNGKEAPLGVDVLARISRGLDLSPRKMIEEEPPPVKQVPTGRTGVPVRQPTSVRLDDARRIITDAVKTTVDQAFLDEVSKVVRQRGAELKQQKEAKSRRSGP